MLIVFLFAMEGLQKLLDELEREKKKKEHDGYMSVTVYSYVYRILGIILLVLNSITILVMIDKSVRSMLFEYALEVFLMMSLYNDLVSISFWCNENKKNFSDSFFTLWSRLGELCGPVELQTQPTNNSWNSLASTWIL